MPEPNPIRRAADLGLKVTSHLAFLAPLLTRLTLGYTFFLTGRGKLANPEYFKQLVDMIAQRGVPFPVANAFFVASLECFGGLFLVLGLLTRLTSLALAGTMLVALNWGEFFSSWHPEVDKGPLDFSEWVILLLLSWLVLHGPGAASLDALLKRWLFGSPTPPAPPAEKAPEAPAGGAAPGSPADAG